MKRPSLRPLQKATPFLALAAALLFVYAPTAFGFSAGISSEDAAWDPTHGGCTASGCHGGGAFASQDAGITVTFVDEAGEPIAATYEHGATYTVTIDLDEQQNPEADNHGGFNFFIDAGELSEVDETARVAAGGSEATHTGAGFTTWTFAWTAPEEGAATWRLFVNDVDGSAAPDAGDMVYLKGGWLTDDGFAMPGAVEEHEVHYGVSLPQYWLGLIALAMMAVIIVFGFVYLKYVNPHNTNQKDR